METKLLKIPVVEIATDIKSRPLNDKHVAELAVSIKAEGLHTPISVFTRHGPLRESYILAGGGHRLAAVVALGMPEVDAVILGAFESEEQVRSVQLSENVQRENMTALQEAEGFERMMEGGRTVGDLADALGRPMRFINERLALLALTESGREALTKGHITLAHARLLARVHDAEAQDEILKAVRGGQDWRGKPAKDGEYMAPRDTSVAERLVEQVQRELSKAPWDLEFAFGQCGACSICPHNSANRGELFQDGQKKPICMNAPCFTDKNVQTTRAARRAAFYIRKLEREPTPANIIEAKQAKDAQQVKPEAIRAALKRINAVKKAGGAKQADGKGEEDSQEEKKRLEDEAVGREFKAREQAWQAKAIKLCADKLRPVAFAGAYMTLICRTDMWRQAEKGRLKQADRSHLLEGLKQALKATEAGWLTALARLVKVPEKPSKSRNELELLLDDHGSCDVPYWGGPSQLILLMVEAFGVELPAMPTRAELKAKMYPPKKEKPKAVNKAGAQRLAAAGGSDKKAKAGARRKSKPAKNASKKKRAKR